MTTWTTYRLGDAVMFNPPERLAKGTIAKKVAMEQLQPFTRAISGYELAAYSGGSKFRKGDTLMARITPCLENGKTAYVSLLDNDEVGFGSTEYIVLRNIEGVTDDKFLYYFVTNPWFRDIAIKSMVGSSGRQRVQQSLLECLKITLPPLSEQQRIAAILGALDDKIELNRRINANLEEQARGVFKSWFVDNYDEKWKSGIVSDFYDISIGKTPPRKESQWFSKSPNNIIWVSIADMGNCGMYIANSSEYLSRDAVNKFNIAIIPDNTVLLSFKLTIGRVVITDGEMTTNEAIAHFKTDNPFLVEYTYLALKNYKYSNLGSTSSIATAINSKIIKTMPWIMPNEDAINKFHYTTAPIFETIKNNSKENQLLSALRDALLPKLMRGEIALE